MSTIHPRATVFGTLAVDGWAVTFGTARRGLGTLNPRATVFGTLAVGGWAVTFGTAYSKEGTGHIKNQSNSLWYTGH